jgi:predicted PurR-regulated permease PerM
MARAVSFVVLVVATSVLLALFYKVVSVFLLPLFLAAVTVLMLRPLHLRVVRRCGNRRYLAAMLMTVSILLAVLIPVVTVFVIAGYEAAELVERLDNETVKGQVEQARYSLGLNYPFAVECRFIETSLEQLRVDAGQAAAAKGDVAALRQIAEEFRRMNGEVKERSLLGSATAASRVETALERASEATPGSLAYQQSVELAAGLFQDYKIDLLGGAWRLPLKEIANPTTADLRRLTGEMFAITPGGLASFSGATSVVLVKGAFSLLIFVMALFFWFADGPEIIRALMVLSPMEDRYEQTLLDEFEVLVRAVVAGSIASATAQAVLSGLGFWFAGLESMFLLMAMTAVLAMVPFLGASLVWVPVCLWLAFGEGRMMAGLGLAIYGIVIVSTVDNVIRPWIIVERAALHPLAGLVGVLGGIQALGPAGVFIGPIVVAFLQTLLTLLHREFSESETPEDGVPSNSDNSVPSVVAKA